MENIEITVPTLLGMEAFAAKEIRRMGYETTVEDGRVTFSGDLEAVCRTNMQLRTGERVLIKIGEFQALSFEELFEKTYSLEWERWIGKNSAFPVKGHCLKSKLASTRDAQAIIKKSHSKKIITEIRNRMAAGGRKCLSDTIFDNERQSNSHDRHLGRTAAQTWLQAKIQPCAAA